MTPKGINQHYKLGSRLKQEYLQELRILDDSPILPELLHVYTSNTDRTILSVSSLVDGMFPYVSQSFIVEGEPDLTGKNYQGIRIHIADTARKWTPVLHGYKNNPKFDFIKKKAFENATLFKEVAKDPKYLALLDKLWDMTHHECISPEKDIVKRFSHMGPLYNQISIERALKMPLFANTKNIYLTSSDEEMIETLAEESRHIHFTGNNSDEQRELGRAGAGLLPLALIDSFRKRINNLETREPPRKKIVLFSAHDYTIMSLLSHLGFRDWVLPNFAAYLIFELHRINSAYYVRLRYNPDPMVFKKSNELRDYIIPMNGSCTVMKDAPRGMMEYQEFERTVMLVKKSFATEDEWYQDAHSVDEVIAEEAKRESK
uniref:Acid phosphatase n=1 Tax=Arcella intermedia TaxID=1963864 RepID=A0A6B2L5V3_9EUKA